MDVQNVKEVNPIYVPTITSGIDTNRVSDYEKVSVHLEEEGNITYRKV